MPRDAAPASEPLLKLDRLDAQRLAVLVSHGADNEHSAYDRVLEFYVSPGSTGEIGGGPPSSHPATAHPHGNSSSNPPTALHSYPVSVSFRSPPPDDHS